MIVVDEDDNYVQVYPGMNRLYIRAIDADAGVTAELTVEQAEALYKELPAIIGLAAARRLSVYTNKDSS